MEGRWAIWRRGENSNSFGGNRHRRLEEKRKEGKGKRSRDTETTVFLEVSETEKRTWRSVDLLDMHVLFFL